MLNIDEVADNFKGNFYQEPEKLAERLKKIKAFVFDWDGVFNGGQKDDQGSSSFSEIDAMGTNLLRFNHHLRTNQQAITAIISGESNKAATTLGLREHFDAVYSGIKFKAEALEHLCARYKIQPTEVAFVFDDVLDFSMAALCGLRIMVRRKCNPLMIKWAEKQSIIDYLTDAEGNEFAVREASELLTGLSGFYEATIGERSAYTTRYQEYLQHRNEKQTQFFTVKDSIIISL